MKIQGTIILVIFSSSLVYSQDPKADGFSTDVIVPDFLKRSLKTYYAYDNSGTLLSQPFLFSELDFSSYELISANISFSDKNSTQKVIIAPMKLLQSDFKSMKFLKNTKLNFAQKDGISTIGISLSGDNSSPFTTKNKERAKNLTFPRIPKIPDNTDFGKFTKVLADYKDSLNVIIAGYDEARLKNVWKYSVGFNTQLFSVFGAKGTSNGFDSLNSYSTKSKTVSASLTYSRASGQFEITANYNYIRSRKAAAENNSLQPYRGPSVSLKKRLFKMVGDTELRKSKDYVQSHFIPSVDVGVAFEGKYFKGNNLDQAEDYAKTTEAITFFLDFKISPSAQFRLGIPRTRTIKIDKTTESGFGALIQYNFKIVNLGG